MANHKRYAVCIHVYYLDMWEDLSAYIAHAAPVADVYVTCRHEIHVTLSAKVKKTFPDAYIDIMPNIGMDVLPFIQLCQDRSLHTYDAVLKLHTKNKKTTLRKQQGDIMLDGLCGTGQLVEQITKVFQTDRNAGMVGAAFQMRSANTLMYGNRQKVAEILTMMDTMQTDWPFFTGTMFWIAGPLLRDIAQMAPELMAMAQAEAQGKTGGDGSLAHALERVFGAICQSAAGNVYLTERRDPDSGTHTVSPLRLHGPANHWRLRELGSADLVLRHAEASNWIRMIRNSDLFDSEYYQSISAPYAVPGIDPAYHFILYGDLFELDPSAGFDTTYYQLRRRDVVRANMCSLIHYIQSGRHENTAARPEIEDWYDLADRHNLFDADWYQDCYPDTAHSQLSAKEHYRLIGERLKRAASVRFQPDKIPFLDRATSHTNTPIVSFLKNCYIDENHLYAILKRAGENGDLGLIKALSSRISNLYGPSRALNEAQATHYTLNMHWDSAHKMWGLFWDEIESGEDSGRHCASVLQFDRPTKALPGFKTLSPEEFSGNLANPITKLPGKICVYTTLFGDIDDLKPVLNPAKGVDYLCFTDRPRAVQGWRQIMIDPQLPSDNLNAKIIKVLPHKYLQDYEYSMFVDANTVFLGRVNELIGLCRAGGDFVMWQHPLREDLYVEICAIISHQRHSPHKLLEQVKHYATEGLPRNIGMFEASFIWRRHMDPAVSGFMEQWWSHIQQFSSRDQISLAYLVWKTATRPILLSPELGTSRRNIFFFKAPHRNGKIRDADAQTAPALQIKKRNISFLYHERYAATGSTFLRGQQLSDLVKNHYDGWREVRYTSCTDDIANEIVVLNKGFLKAASPEQLHELGKNNVLVADFVDEPPKKPLIPEIDALMASSLCGYRDYLNNFPDLPSFHVTHHVDTRIPHRAEAQSDTFRAGYFGELVNTIRDDDIARLVTFNLVDTSKQNDDWIAALEDYNFHYAFRRTREIDGAKPFLKGFVAAHCGANMMIQKSAGDAGLYLGSDYPYLMEDDATPAQIVTVLEHARETVGGPEWRYARAIMREVAERSSLRHVMGEFDAMVAQL